MKDITIHPTSPWPFDLSRYDRHKTFRAGERRALSAAMNEREAGSKRWIRNNRQSLSRLITPLIDALDYLGDTNPSRRTGIISVLLCETHSHQTSFWGWSRQTWRAALGQDHKSFSAKTGYKAIRCLMMAIAYLFGGLDDVYTYGLIFQRRLARYVFGSQHIESLMEQVQAEIRRIGYAGGVNEKRIPNLLCKLLLACRSPNLEAITPELMEDLRAHWGNPTNKEDVVAFSRVLANFGILDHPLRPRQSRRLADQATEGIDTRWIEWIAKWRDTSTLELVTRKSHFYCLCKAGRWIAKVHPELADPAAWGHEHGVEFVSVITRSKIGDWSVRNESLKKSAGKPLAPASVWKSLAAVRAFFRDCQEWGWIPVRFNPMRVFLLPRAVKAKIAPNPRVIEDDAWAKLLWAGLNLTEQDLPRPPSHGRMKITSTRYPLEMVKAIAIVWLFAGLRANEIMRLRVGCIRWQSDDVKESAAGEMLRKDAVCWLDVPVTKTSTSFSKPVDVTVGKAINEWERLRPSQRSALDAKTGEMVHFLFYHREQQISGAYLNRSLIPILCGKAGVPPNDARGAITSHRARSTIATQLFNSRDPMSLFDLQEWLGHSSPRSTQHYARVTPTRLAKRYEQAGYFERNIRTVEVLIDRDAIVSGEAARGKPWQYYDLGHGWCTHAYFVDCPHRMACPKCSFYVAKDSSKGQFIEGQANLIRMIQSIPLTEDERAAVEEGIDLFERLCNKLADVPTPVGPTPRELIQLSMEKQ